jgi:hypothetical protein
MFHFWLLLTALAPRSLECKFPCGNELLTNQGTTYPCPYRGYARKREKPSVQQKSETSSGLAHRPRQLAPAQAEGDRRALDCAAVGKRKTAAHTSAGVPP